MRHGAGQANDPLKRLADRLEHPWKRWKTGADDYRNRAKRKDYLKAMHEMFAAVPVTAMTATGSPSWRPRAEA